MKASRFLIPAALALVTGASFMQTAAAATEGAVYAREVYAQADPLGTQPEQIAARHAAMSRVAGAVRFNGSELLYSSEPFDPLPQFWTRHVAPGAEAAHPAPEAAGQRDLFGRASSGFTADGAYYLAEPIDPLPQFWARRQM